MRIAKLLSLSLLASSCVSQNPPADEVVVPAPINLRIDGEDMVVIGDQGTGTSQQASVARAMETYCAASQQCDYGLMVGDNFYPAGVVSTKDGLWKSRLEDPYKKLNFTFYAALGNHDYMGDWKSQVAYVSPTKRFKMPYRYYKLTTKYADILCLDSEYLDPSQLAWAEEQLKTSSAHWQVVYLHRPIYSSGEHGDTSTLKKILLPMIEKHGVDLVLAGHDHDLELQQRAGILHVVSGSGGKSRSLKNGPYTLYGKDTPGFVAVNFEATSMEVKFIGEGGKTLYTKHVGAMQLMEDQ